VTIGGRKMKKLPLALLVFGVLMVLGGFVYDAVFAGIPYQDPTVEMQARYDRHAGIATKTMWTGFVALIAGIVSLAVIKTASKKEPIQPPQTTTGSSAPDRV
jgi:hypothetical protein